MFVLTTPFPPDDKSIGYERGSTVSAEWFAAATAASAETADYVLGKFSKQDRERVEVMVERAADAAEEWAALGIQAAMNKYN